MKDSTISIHSKKNFKDVFGAVTTPIFQSSAYLYPFKEDKLKYPRYSNLPNQEEVVSKIVELEKAEDGVLFSSGMAAITTTLLTVLKPGDHIVIQDQIYGGTFSFIESKFRDLNIEYSYFDFCSSSAAADSSDFSKAIKSNTKAVYIETPSNPLLKIIDIAEIARVAGISNIISIIDNTFASPINQKPFSLGIDIVVHSATKYLNGHSDLIAGVAVGKLELMKSIKRNARDFGCTTNEMTAYLLSRGLKTLSIRVEKQNFNALKLAEFLEGHKKVSIVNYPGLKSNPHHSIAQKQMLGYGGMLSFEVNMETEELNRCLQNLKIFSRAVSLGGVESLLCLPCETSHSYLSKEERLELGIKDNLIRVSLGIEDIEDLVMDWEQALT